MEQKLSKLTWYSFITMLSVLIIGGLIYFRGSPVVITPMGSVAQSNEYHATTTYSGQPTLLYPKTGSGAFGSLIITKAGTGTGLNYVYDATTTNANLRASTMSTSSIIMAAWPGNLAAGTYTYDQMFINGLIIENNTGTSVGSSTITWR